MIGALAVSVALAACPADVPPAMQLEGVPATLVSGRSYTASLAATGAGQAVGTGWKLGVFDRLGRGYFADLPGLDFQQAFSVGLTGAPYTVSATYAEPTCTRTLSISAAVERRVLGLVTCHRGAVEPRTIVLGCNGRRLRSLTWRGWNSDVAVGRGAGGVRVRLSRPEECAELNGFVYTKARVGGRTYRWECPVSR